MCVSLKTSNFYYYIFHPRAPHLSLKDQRIALIATIAIAVITLGLGHLVCGIILLCKKIKTGFCPENKVEQLMEVKLIKTSKVHRLGFTEIIHELSEIDVEGNYRPCSLERFKEILSILKDKNALYVLNSIPKYIVEHSYKRDVFDIPPSCYTPLQHWVSKGNIEAVKALIQVRASDLCKENNEIHCDKSALYVAAMHGHNDIVQYLLKNGAKANIAFHNNVMFSFVPQFIFEISSKKNITHNQLTCLEIILNHLSAIDPKNLKFQLQIPIDFFDRKDQYVNSIDYLDYRKPSNYQKAKRLLIKFGAKIGKVFSLKKLISLGSNVGTGFTLDETSTFKA